VAFRVSRLVVSALLACLLAWPAHAYAPSSQSQARRLFEAGSLAYDKGRFGAAARAFRESYRLLPNAAIGFSLAQALRRQYFVDGDRQKLLDAAPLYRAYVTDVPEGRRRSDAVEQLQAIELLLVATEPTPATRVDPSPTTTKAPTSEPVITTELIVYTAAPGAEASVDGSSFSEVPLVVQTEPGSHQVVVRAPGFGDASTTVVAIRGRIIPVEARLSPLPAQVTIHALSGARILLDGTELGYAPLPAAVTTPPGSHRIRITAPGRISYEDTLSLDSGAHVELVASTPHTTQRRAAWGVLGSAAVLGVSGGVTLGLALAFQNRALEVERERGQVNLDAEELDAFNADVDRRDGLRSATVVLLSTALVAGVSGLVLVLTDRASQKRGRRRRGSPRSLGRRSASSL